MIERIISIGSGSFILGIFIAVLGVYGGYHILRLFLEYTEKASDEWNHPSTLKYCAHIIFQIISVICLIQLIKAA